MTPARQQVQQAVTAIHTAVPGRARLHVAGLKGSRSLKSYLESYLVGTKTIVSVSASIATGNALIHYDRHASLPVLIETIEQLLRKDRTQLAMRIMRQRSTSWHLMQAAQVLRRFRSSLQGLSPEVFQHRLTR